VQLAAVKKDGSAIKYIPNPTSQVVAAAKSQGYNRKGRLLPKGKQP